MKKITDYYMLALKRYAEFDGRSTRSEYWYFVLCNFIIGIVIGLLVNILGQNTTNALSGLYNLAVLVPSIALGIRRLHDINKSGWWLLISLIPLVGWIWIIVLLATDSDAGDNGYGSNPKLAK